MMVLRCGLLALGLWLAAAPAWALVSAPVASSRAIATLVSEADAVPEGRPFRVALRLKLAPGWHTYWRNPGDAGVAPELSFELPQGVTAGPIVWPTPARQPEGPLMTYGYSGDVLLPVTISGGPGPIRLHATWLVCANICVPEEGDFALDVPAGTPAASSQAALFAAADARSPRPSPWKTTISPEGTLVVHGAPPVREAWVIPSEPDRIVASAPQVLLVRDGSMIVQTTPTRTFKPNDGLDGVLVVRDESGQETALAIAATPGEAPNSLSLLAVLGFAALGGLILNLMPCVFPVLAMKAVGLARLSGKERGHAWWHAAAYAVGVMASFALIGFALLALRAQGAAAGWGFQFQSPVFVAAITLILFAVGLNLSGVYAIGGPVGVGQSLAGRGGVLGSFFTGLLAVLVATPCTAPFMGAAISAGLAGTPATTLAVFLAMGAGLAAPYVVLASIPRVISALPRPGRWMDVLKQGLAFPMYGACVWLVWVLSQQAGPAGVLAVGTGLLLVGVAGWAFGLAQAGTGRVFTRVTAALAGTLAILVLLAFAAMPQDAQAVAAEAGVEPFSSARLAELRVQGRPVLVNMTAAWCVTCLVNERVALSSERVRDALAARGVTYMKGDWTRQDPDITAFLRRFDRDGVPLYALFPAGPGAPVFLPQLLTEATVLDAVGRLTAD